MSGPVPVFAIPRAAPSEHACSFDDEIAVDAGDAARDLGSDRFDRGAQPVEVIDPPGAELLVVEALGEDRAQQRGEQRDVGPGDELQMEIGVRGNLGAPGIHHDQLQSTRPRLLEPAQPVVHREAGEVATLHRHQRVGSHQHPDVAVFEALAPAAQLPRRALATHFADWSMVIVENRLWDPTARSHAPAKLNVSDAV